MARVLKSLEVDEEEVGDSIRWSLVKWRVEEG